jgi:hypothetical protein
VGIAQKAISSMLQVLEAPVFVIFAMFDLFFSSHSISTT